MKKQLTKREANEFEAVDEQPSVRPPVDIYENRDEYLLVADMPAVLKDDLKIQIDEDRLTIEGKAQSEVAEDAIEREFRLLNYRRSFELPNFIDRSKVSAELKRGVLYLHLPKSEAVKPKRIEVRVG